MSFRELADQGSSAPGTVIETHLSVLTFDGDIVRKRKKAVRLPFVDFATPELRLAACRQEVMLNRRLAPDVYLGVDEVRDHDGRLTEAVVVMRRLPDHLQLRKLVEAGLDVHRELQRVAHVLAAFHSTAVRAEEIDQVATPEGLQVRWDADVDELEPLVRKLLDVPVLDRERSLVHRFLDSRCGLLQSRIEGGHIVDGHGDLRADSIFCLADRPRIIDCLEFDAALRWGDELADVAFLAMDLEALARPDLSDYFVRSYGRFAGWSAPRPLLDFYIAQRAAVRSKVACWRVLQGESAALAPARIHLDQCRRHLARARPLLVLLGGAPRTGKSTIARLLAEATGFVPLRSDEVRRDATVTSRALHIGRDPLDSGRYAAAATAATYATLASRARSLLRAGYVVILDATFSSASSRASMRQVAHVCQADMVEIECTAPASVIALRANQPRRADDLSEATPATASALLARRAPWPSAHRLVTTAPGTTLLGKCMTFINETPVGTVANP